ncbi:tetratricopeptide repeat protein [Kitasatospora sp. NPDC059088]|uniref:tetratricopeptide repeat protein n=1 Tax=Kitasatospora sp. NPDC059088 TaxID=3346722 RepID=UPI0036A2AF7A
MTSTTPDGNAAQRRPGLLRRLRTRLHKNPLAPAAAPTAPPPRHAPTPPTATTVARLHIATAVRTGRLADAARLSALHVDDTARRFGADHPYTAEALEILGQVSALTGDHQRALTCLLQAAHHRAVSPMLATPDPIPGLAQRALASSTASHGPRPRHLATATAR